jgi:transcriptional regulator with XRE-family HTH domain
MSDPSLIQQLGARTKTFLHSTNLSQKELARILRVDKSNFNKFLSGQAGLSAETTLALVRLMNLSKRDLALKFGEPERTRAKLLHWQENGKLTHLSIDGWVAGTGPDPNDADITDVNNDPARSALTDDDLEFLAGLAAMHKAIIDKIDARQVQKARVNKSGSTESPRSVDTNRRSSLPGPKGDQDEKTPEQMRDYLKWLKAKREAEELKVLRLVSHVDVLRRNRARTWLVRPATSLTIRKFGQKAVLCAYL